MLALNLAPNGYATPPTAFPIRLWSGGETTISIVVPKGALSVSAVLACESGTANAHIALYAAPATSGGIDGVLVGSQVDLLGLGTQQQTIAVSVPSTLTTAPAVYVCRVWVDGVTGTATGKSRSGGTADMLPVGVKVYSVVVA